MDHLRLYALSPHQERSASNPFTIPCGWNCVLVFENIFNYFVRFQICISKQTLSITCFCYYEFVFFSDFSQEPGEISNSRKVAWISLPPTHPDCGNTNISVSRQIFKSRATPSSVAGKAWRNPFMQQNKAPQGIFKM